MYSASVKVIVTTTINSPTEAIRKFAQMEDWEMVIVLDRKTPENYFVPSAHVLTVEAQESLFPEVSTLIGWDCIQRRNLGFLYALQMGAKIIATVDDDNIPLPGWGEKLILGPSLLRTYVSEQVAFDPISVTNHKEFWHRGYPLELVRARQVPKSDIETAEISIQADFWNGDPDIDAIAREIYKPYCSFDDSDFPFTANVPSPFNSQNTFLSRSVFPDYFLFPFVGRMDDIWASYYVQSRGHKVAYNKASVIQIRNVHQFQRDFDQEILGYKNNLDLIKSLKQDPKNILNFLPSRTNEAWLAYREAALKL